MSGGASPAPSSSPPRLGDEELADLERLVGQALRSADEEALPILGYGEISLVLAWPPAPSAGERQFACKRLPAFGTDALFERYRETLRDYIAALEATGMHVVPTELRGVELPGGAVAGYVVQPILPSEQLAPAVLAAAGQADAVALIEAVTSQTAATIGPHLGLDAQLSNWIWDGEALTYIDVSTPLIWDASGRCLLDLELIAQPFPPPLRWPLRRFLAPRILDGYRDLRGVFLDLCGNLLKARLDRRLPEFVAAANEHLAEPLTVAEVERYYRSDRRLWAALLWLRMLDRAWQRNVRRRAYPYLLPGRTER